MLSSRPPVSRTCTTALVSHVGERRMCVCVWVFVYLYIRVYVCMDIYGVSDTLLASQVRLIWGWQKMGRKTLSRCRFTDLLFFYFFLFFFSFFFKGWIYLYVLVKEVDTILKVHVGEVRSLRNRSFKGLWYGHIFSQSMHILKLLCKSNLLLCYP